jgi:hypothetical protein
MKIVNGKLVTESQEEAVQILKDLGLGPYYKKGYGIAMGILQSEILENGHDYPVIWDCDCENGAFKVYDDICVAGDKYFLSYIGTNKRYAESYEDLQNRIKLLMKEILKILNNSLEKTIDKNLA